MHGVGAPFKSRASVLLHKTPVFRPNCMAPSSSNFCLPRSFSFSYKNKDGAAGGFGLIAEPDVVVETLTSDDDMVVLATDGVFEVLSNEEVADFVKAAG